MTYGTRSGLFGSGALAAGMAGGLAAAAIASPRDLFGIDQKFGDRGAATATPRMTLSACKSVTIKMASSSSGDGGSSGDSSSCSDSSSCGDGGSSGCGGGGGCGEAAAAALGYHAAGGEHVNGIASRARSDCALFIFSSPSGVNFNMAFVERPIAKGLSRAIQ